MEVYSGLTVDGMKFVFPEKHILVFASIAAISFLFLSIFLVI